MQVADRHRQKPSLSAEFPDRLPCAGKLRAVYIMNKQNAMCLNDLKPYTGKINEMKNYMDEHKFFNKEPNELAFNYSIWVVFIKNRDGNVNTISANTLAQDVVAIYNNFSEYFEY